MKLTNSQKNVSMNVPLGDNPKNILAALLGHAMNKTSTRQSADVPMTASEAAALGIPSTETPAKGRQGRTKVPVGRK